jgi:hypothetical protein
MRISIFELTGSDAIQFVYFEEAFQHRLKILISYSARLYYQYNGVVNPEHCFILIVGVGRCGFLPSAFSMAHYQEVESGL